MSIWISCLRAGSVCSFRSLEGTPKSTILALLTTSSHNSISIQILFVGMATVSAPTDDASVQQLAGQYTGPTGIPCSTVTDINKYCTTLNSCDRFFVLQNAQPLTRATTANGRQRSASSTLDPVFATSGAQHECNIEQALRGEGFKSATNAPATGSVAPKAAESGHDVLVMHWEQAVNALCAAIKAGGKLQLREVELGTTEAETHSSTINSKSKSKQKLKCKAAHSGVAANTDMAAATAAAVQASVLVDGLGVSLKGRVDFLLLSPTKSTTASEQPYQYTMSVIECKASQQSYTAHVVQLVLYRLMMRQLLKSCLYEHRSAQADWSGLRHVDSHNIQCVLAYQGHPAIANGFDQDWLSACTVPADLLDRVENDLCARLVPNGQIVKALTGGLANAKFSLGSHCSKCPNGRTCLQLCHEDKALQLAGATDATVECMKAAGVCDLEDLIGAEDAQLNHITGTSQDIVKLQKVAKLRCIGKTSNDPNDAEAGASEVELQHVSGMTSTLPPHHRDMIRVYLAVEVHQISHRVAAIACHQTCGPGLTAGQMPPLAKDDHRSNIRLLGQQMITRGPKAKLGMSCSVWGCVDEVGQTDVCVSQQYYQTAGKNCSQAQWNAQYQQTNVANSNTGRAQAKQDSSTQKDTDDTHEAALILSSFHWLLHDLNTKPQMVHMYVFSRCEVRQLMLRCLALCACKAVSAADKQHLNMLLMVLSSCPGVTEEQHVYSVLQTEMKR